jgi:hypothetical protein
MHSVILNSNTKLGEGSATDVHDAVMWCDTNIGRDQYDISNQFPSWRWEFKFQQQQDAVHFALLWA